VVLGWFGTKQGSRVAHDLPEVINTDDIKSNGLLFDDEQIEYAIKLAESAYQWHLEKLQKKGRSPTPDHPLSIHIGRKELVEMQQQRGPRRWAGLRKGQKKEYATLLTGERLDEYQATPDEKKVATFPSVTDSKTKVPHGIEVVFDEQGKVSKMWVPYYGEHGHPEGRNKNKTEKEGRVEAGSPTVEAGSNAKAVIVQCVYDAKHPEEVGQYDILLKQRKGPTESSAKFLAGTAVPEEIYNILKQQDSVAAEHFKAHTCLPKGTFEEQYGPDKDRSAVVLPLRKGGDLWNALYAQRRLSLRTPGSWSFEQRLQLAIEIAEGVALMHQAGWVHFDIKAENILIDKEGRHAYLCDFGFACPMTEAIEKRIYGTRQLMDKRLFDKLAKLQQDRKSTTEGIAYARAAEIYAVGGTIWPLLGFGWKEINKLGKEGAQQVGMQDAAHKYGIQYPDDIEVYKKDWTDRVDPDLLLRAKQLIYNMTCVYQTEKPLGDRGRYDDMAPILEELRSIQQALREKRHAALTGGTQRPLTSIPSVDDLSQDSGYSGDQGDNNTLPRPGGPPGNQSKH
jgi:serine/threonine protein kinase